MNLLHYRTYALKRTLFIVWYRAAIATKKLNKITPNPHYPTLFTVHPKQ